MTKTNKTLLMTLLSSVLILCAALAAIFATQISSVKADTPDYLSWNRTAIAEGDLLANRYVLMDKTAIGESEVHLVFDNGSGDYIYGDLYYNSLRDFNRDYLPDVGLVGIVGSGSIIEIPPLYTDDDWDVFYITPFTSTENDSKSLKQTSTLYDSSNAAGVYFITESTDGETTTTPDTGDNDTETTLPTFDSSTYNATYVEKGLDVFGSYVVVPASFTTSGIIGFEDGYAINIISPTEIEYRGVVLECVGVTTRYGEKAYVYDFTTERTITDADGKTAEIKAENFVIVNLSIAVPENVYILTTKTTSTTPDVDDPTTETPVEEEQTDFLKFLDVVSAFFEEHTGVVLGSTGALIVLAVLLYIIIRRR